MKRKRENEEPMSIALGVDLPVMKVGDRVKRNPKVWDEKKFVRPVNEGKIVSRKGNVCMVRFGDGRKQMYLVSELVVIKGV